MAGIRLTQSHEHLFPLSHARDTQEDVRREAVALEAVPLLRELLEAFPTMAVILNARRQILMYNDLFARAIPVGNEDMFLAMRLGDSVGCEVARGSAAGCGSGEACRMCGALLAMLDAAEGERGVRECSIALQGDEGHHAVEFRVVAVPVDVDGHRVTLLSLVDISDEKRRLALERIFFHDILNTASGVRSIADLLRMVDEADRGELIDDLNGLSDQLIEEIQGQRELLAAERGELETAGVELTAGEVLAHVHALYRYHILARERSVVAEARDGSLAFRSDPTILARVLGNLAKNALEATPSGGTVTLSNDWMPDGSIRFSVRNPTVIPEPARTQIFKRSFSTKGAGRGLGTYSARLLTEKYLGGVIGFETGEGIGTLFHVTLPARHSFPSITVDEENTR